MMKRLYLCKVVLILVTPNPTISFTSAENPAPFVPSSSKTIKSLTLYPEPPSKIWRLSTPPLVTDSIFDNCLIVSFDSIIKSLSAYSSSTA